MLVEVREQFVGLILSIYHAGPWNQTQIFRLGGKHLYPWCHPASLHFKPLKRIVVILLFVVSKVDCLNENTVGPRQS